MANINQQTVGLAAGRTTPKWGQKSQGTNLLHTERMAAAELRQLKEALEACDSLLAASRGTHLGVTEI